MTTQPFKPLAKSSLTPKENLRRKEVIVPSRCWKDDFEVEVNAHATGRYSLRYIGEGQTAEADRSARYKIYVRVASANEVFVEVRCSLIGGIEIENNFKRYPQTEALKMKPVIEKGVDAWNGRFILSINDPRCGIRTVPIKYGVVWTSENYHYEIEVRTVQAREKVAQDVVFIKGSTSEWAMTHEFGHCLGLPDEYAAMKEIKYVKYIKPDGSLDVRIDTPAEKESDADDSSMMSTHGSDEFLPRHAWNIAIEVQELLSQKLNRNVKCDIQLA